MRYEHGVVEKGEQLVRSVREWVRGDEQCTHTVHLPCIYVSSRSALLEVLASLKKR